MSSTKTSDFGQSKYPYLSLAKQTLLQQKISLL